MRLPPSKVPKQHFKRRLNFRGSSHWTLTIFLVVWLAIIGLAAANLQHLRDWWILRTYHAPASVQQLAGQDTMTPYARNVFYVNQPDIESKTTFSTNCPNNGGEQTIVLGCYHSDQAGIFLLQVTDPRLNGVEQVTAAHEMLHAAYDRLNSSDKGKVDAMLLDYYNHDLHDQRLLDTIAAYKKTEPNDVVNEMHSIFGTEVANLPQGLENYYKRYFTDRSKVAGYAAQYESAFTSRQAQLDQDKSTLDSLQSQINSNEVGLKSKQAAINAAQAQLLSQKNNGDISSYNAGVPGYNALIDDYNAEVQSTQSLINQYNQLRLTYNNIVFEQDQLVNELSSSSAPIKQ